jgi:hypothetical protein
LAALQSAVAQHHDFDQQQHHDFNEQQTETMLHMFAAAA